MDLRKITADAVRRFAEMAAGRVEKLRCEVHGQAPQNVRVEPSGSAGARVVAGYCCDALQAKALTAIRDDRA